MNKLVPLFLAAVVVFGVVLYFFDERQTADWKETYAIDKKRPYDLTLFYKLLQTNYPIQATKNRVETTLDKDAVDIEKQLYIFGGKSPVYTEDEAWQVKTFAEAGGTVFFISKFIPDTLKQFLFFSEDCGGDLGRLLNITRVKSVSAHFEHPSLRKYNYAYTAYDNGVEVNGKWLFLNDAYLCDSDNRNYDITKLGYYDAPRIRKTPQGSVTVMGKYCNFFKLNVGKGTIYFHLNPSMFCNLNLVDSVGVDYVSNVMTHFGDKQIVWDLVSASAKDKAARTKPDVPAQTPFEYIFSQQALRLSWYLFLALSFLYVIFRARRRQRIVPVLSVNENTSLEFIQTISRLYFQQQDHKGMVRKQMELFLAHLRQRYHLVTKELNIELMKRVSARSKVDLEIIQAIFIEYERLKPNLSNNRRQVSVAELNHFYELIQTFHETAAK